MVSPRSVRLAIVNDYEIVVHGLAAVLEPFADQVLVVETDSRLAVLSDVDVLLYDTFAQPQGSAMNVSSLVLDQSARVVVFSWNIDERLIAQALENGAAGYVAKSTSAKDLVECLLRVHEGEQVVYVDRDASEPTSGRVGRWPGDEYGLSPREAEVLALVCQGISNREITERAFIGINTVKTHIRALYRKIGVTTRSQAVRWGLTHGFEARSSRSTLDD